MPCKSSLSFLLDSLTTWLLSLISGDFRTCNRETKNCGFRAHNREENLWFWSLQQRREEKRT